LGGGFDLEYPDFDLTDQVALVTGASKGIGYALAKALAHAGAKVAIAARSVDLLTKLAEEIKAEGGDARVFALDVRNVDQIRQVFEQVAESYVRLDILVNNAGMGSPIPALEVTEQYWDHMMDLNLKGLFFCCQQAAKIMVKNGYGRIVNMSSQASVVGIPQEAVYCTSKAGVNMLSKALALEWSGSGITINAVGPTFVYTPGTAARLDDPAFSKPLLAQIPVGRVGTVTDVAAAVLFYASPAASMITGTMLLVDGGYTAH
jgi:NAD(P)-dependent dehydrogenase (short-subunit alcohol dehydrogenase family)